MGWKSTKQIKRSEAISAIFSEMSKLHLKTNDELELIMRDMFGDDVELPYYGHNFDVVDYLDEED